MSKRRKGISKHEIATVTEKIKEVAPEPIAKIIDNDTTVDMMNTFQNLIGNIDIETILNKFMDFFESIAFNLEKTTKALDIIDQQQKAIWQRLEKIDSRISELKKG